MNHNTEALRLRLQDDTIEWESGRGVGREGGMKEFSIEGGGEMDLG